MTETDTEAEYDGLIVSVEDYGTESAYSGYGDYIHIEEGGCENSPDGRRLLFDVRDGGGSADLCPDCEWPEWVVSLRNGDEDTVTDN